MQRLIAGMMDDGARYPGGKTVRPGERFVFFSFLNKRKEKKNLEIEEADRVTDFN